MVILHSFLYVYQRVWLTMITDSDRMGQGGDTHSVRGWASPFQWPRRGKETRRPTAKWWGSDDSTVLGFWSNRKSPFLMGTSPFSMGTSTINSHWWRKGKMGSTGNISWCFKTNVAFPAGEVTSEIGRREKWCDYKRCVEGQLLALLSLCLTEFGLFGCWISFTGNIYIYMYICSRISGYLVFIFGWWYHIDIPFDCMGLNLSAPAGSQSADGRWGGEDGYHHMCSGWPFQSFQQTITRAFFYLQCLQAKSPKTLALEEKADIMALTTRTLEVGPCNISETMWDCQGHADFQVERAERASHSQVEMDTEATWGFGPCIMKRTLKPGGCHG